MKQSSKIYVYTEEKYYAWAKRMAKKHNTTLSEFFNCLLKHVYKTERTTWEPQVEYKEIGKKK